MTMYIKIAEFLASSPMRRTIAEAWEKRKMGLFVISLILLLGFAFLSWGIPKLLPEKVVRNGRYAKMAMWALGIGLLCLFLSFALGIGFGFGSGKGLGLGEGAGGGESTGETQKRERKSEKEGEIFVTVTGCTVYVDAEVVPVDTLRDYIAKKDTDRKTIVLIDDYSDYATYAKVVAILDDALADGQYEKRKGE